MPDRLRSKPVNNFYLVGEPQLSPSGGQLSRDVACRVSGPREWSGKNRASADGFSPEVRVYNLPFASLYKCRCPQGCRWSRFKSAGWFPSSARFDLSRISLFPLSVGASPSDCHTAGGPAVKWLPLPGFRPSPLPRKSTAERTFRRYSIDR